MFRNQSVATNVKDALSLAAFTYTMVMAVKGWAALGKSVAEVVAEKIDPNN